MKTPLLLRPVLLLGLLLQGILPLVAAAAPYGGTALVNLGGTVFEDPNYGGGAGRPLSTTGTVGRSGATVELYSSTGLYLQTTTTTAGGAYSFSVNSDASYQVRVVSSTVTSSRTGYVAGLLPVQTYAGVLTDANAVNRVGGVAPQLADTTANTSAALSTLTSTKATAQSVVQVTLGSTGVSTLNFGFCFDVVVNANNTRQGSLRQFILNANALGGESSLAQVGFSRSTTSPAGTALAARRETSIFMIPDGNAHAGQLAGLVSGLTSQNGQLVAIIRIPSASNGYTLVGTNAQLTTVDGGTQTYNIGNTNAAVLGTGGNVGTTGVLSYTSFSGPEVQLLGLYDGATVATRKPSNAFVVQADDFTVRNVAVRNFGNIGGNGAITLGNTPAQTSAVRLTVENNVLGTDASSFAAPSAITALEGDNGRNNQQIQVTTSGASVTVKTLTVHTNLLGYSERRGVHIQGNATISAGYNINLSIYDNVFKGAGVAGAAPGDVGPYQNSASGAIELILLTAPYVEIYQNQITGPDEYLNPLYAGTADGGSDGIQLNNAKVTIPGVTSTANDARDAGQAQDGSRIDQNTITQQRLGLLCQSNIVVASYALDGVSITGNRFTNNVNGVYNQGASHVFQSNLFSLNAMRGMVNLGPNVTFTTNTFSTNGTDGLLIGDFTLSPSTATKPAVTGVVVGAGNVFSNNGTVTGASNGVGLSVVNNDTRAIVTQSSFYGNGSLSIDLNNSTSGRDGVTANNGLLNAAFPNQELDYPIFQRASLVGTTLTVVGYVGSAPGQTAFGNLPVEVYAADNNPANQNGQTVAGDNLSVAHGEGRTYLGTVFTAADGTFIGSITVPAGTGLATGGFVTGFTTIGSGATASTSEFGTNAQLGDPILQGYVFEDPNYGGGSGRPRATAGTSARPGATVELYDAAGAYVGNTTTDATGLYTFAQATLGAYTVRVVNSTVTSSRTGYVAGLLPVQTYNGTTTRVGGESPAKVDAGANTTNAPLSTVNTINAGATAQSLGAVTAAGFTGPDFGFNFDLVVNTNNAGQGSFRQFLTNANTLGGEASLAQSGTRADTVGTIVSLPAGKETSIFMISDGNAHPGLLAYNGATNPGLVSQLTPSVNGVASANSVALITATSLLTVGGANASNTVLDGGTQTANIGNNVGVAANAAATTVGVNTLALTAVRRAAVEIQATGLVTMLDIEAPATTVRALALHSADRDGSFNNSQVVLVGNSTSATNYVFEGVLVGTAATGSRLAVASIYQSEGFGINFRSGANSGTVVHSLIAYNGNSGLNINNGTGTSRFTNNFVVKNGFLDSSGDGMTFGDNGGSGPANILKNYFFNQNSSGIQFEIGSTSATTVTNNTITQSGGINDEGAAQTDYEGSGIDYLLRGSTPRGSQTDIIRRNIITGSQTAGIVVGYGQQNVTMSENSTYDNGGLGIDLVSSTSYYVNGGNPNYGNGNGVTPNDGNVPATTADLPNKGADFPVLATATVTGSNLVVTGFSRPGAIVEFFIRDTDATGFGEGQTYFATRTEGTAQDADATTGSYGPSNVNGLAQGSDATANRFIFTLPFATLTAAQQAALRNMNNGLTATATFLVSGVGNTSEFSGKVIVTGVLPVSLTVFTAQAVRNQDGLLKWTTATETDNDRFDVERSFDGKSFAKIGQAAGQGTKLTATEYTFTDLNVVAKATGLVYYRLRQVDFDGTATYSPVRTVSFTPDATSGVALYPTLTAGTTTLDLSQLPAASSYQVLLTDMTGRSVRAWTLAGGLTQTLNVSELAPGIYHLLVTGQQPGGVALRQSLRLTKE